MACCYKSRELQLIHYKTGWKLVFNSTMSWIVESNIFLRIHGASGGKSWTSTLHLLGSFQERVESVDGIGSCRILSFEGNMDRYGTR